MSENNNDFLDIMELMTKNVSDVTKLIKYEIENTKDITALENIIDNIAILVSSHKEENKEQMNWIECPVLYLGRKIYRCSTEDLQFIICQLENKKYIVRVSSPQRKPERIEYKFRTLEEAKTTCLEFWRKWQE